MVRAAQELEDRLACETSVRNEVGETHCELALID